MATADHDWYVVTGNQWLNMLVVTGSSSNYGGSDSLSGVKSLLSREVNKHLEKNCKTPATVLFKK